MSKTYRPWNPNQQWLLRPSVQDWLPENDLVYFILDTVNELDISAIMQKYEQEKRGFPPYHPRMMVALLLYAYCRGIFSSRKIMAACRERLTFRVITGDDIPDFRTISDFRKLHLKELQLLFVQVLRLCQEAGLVKLGHIALDGTKVKANASKHKAMSSGGMEKKAEELEAEVRLLLQEAQAVDDAEDALYGKGKGGDELPEELRFKQRRLEKIKEAMESLEQEAKAEAQARGKEIAEKEQALKEQGKKRRGKKPRDPKEKPDPKAQRNFTDADSRIMKDSASKSFEQGYNCQVVVGFHCHFTH